MQSRGRSTISNGIRLAAATLAFITLTSCKNEESVPNEATPEPVIAESYPSRSLSDPYEEQYLPSLQEEEEEDDEGCVMFVDETVTDPKTGERVAKFRVLTEDLDVIYRYGEGDKPGKSCTSTEYNGMVQRIIVKC